MALCWDDIMVTTLRIITDDVDESPENTDDNLKQLILVASKIVMMRVDFDTDYSINLSSQSITPDPSTDVAFVNLVCMKAACMLARSEQKDRARKGVNFRDGPASIDGRGAADATAKWSDSICKEYLDYELQYKIGNRQPGKAILGPYRYENSVYQTPINPRYINDSYNNGYFN